MPRRVFPPLILLLAVTWLEQTPALALATVDGDSVIAKNTTKVGGEVSKVINAPTVEAKPAYLFRSNRICTSAHQSGRECDVFDRVCNEKPGGFAVSQDYRKNEEGSTWELFRANACMYPGDPLDRPSSPPRPAFSITQFRSLPLKPAKIITQPGRHTLKGAHTNIYAEVSEQGFSPRLAGKVVSVRAHPSSFAWNYGDGTTKTLPIQGGPLRPDQAELDSETRTSHVYGSTGDYDISVTTIYTGEYSVDGGAWVPIIGTAQVNSPAIPMSVWRTETHLVAENCLENPGGWACPDARDGGK